MFDAFNNVQRTPSTLPPRLKPYLPKATPESISDASDTSEPIRRTSAPRPQVQRREYMPDEDSLFDTLGDQDIQPVASTSRAKPYLPNNTPERPVQRKPAEVSRPSVPPPPPRQTDSNDLQSRMLAALDLAPTTPVEGSWDAHTDEVQRVVAIEEMTSEVNAAPSEAIAYDDTQVEALAQKVFRLLRKRLRVDRERRDL
jgi:hypothetical protein